MLLRRRRTVDSARALAELEAVRREGAAPGELLQARHRAGVALLERPSVAEPRFPEPDFDALPAGTVAEVTPAQLTPGVVRAAFLRGGCLLVRGLVGPQDVDRLLEEINRAYDARREGGEAFEEFRPVAAYEQRLAFDRDLVGRDGWAGLWPADAPRAASAMFDAFDRAGILGLAKDYLGEHPAVSVNKSLLRRVDPPAAGEDSGASAWHQDGAFLGPVRALNVWLALSRCGDVAPGLDLVPRRIDGIAPRGTEGAVFDWSVSQAVAEDAAGEDGIVRPVFEPGDVLLFDELFLHATATSPDMDRPRYAVECWFFGPSAYPEGYAPLAV